MAKTIKYRFLSCEVTRGPESEQYTEPVILGKIFACNTQAQLNSCYAVAEAEALPDTIEVFGEFDPVPDPGTDGAAIWEELDAAYQKGVDSV